MGTDALVVLDADGCKYQFNAKNKHINANVSVSYGTNTKYVPGITLSPLFAEIHCQQDQIACAKRKASPSPPYRRALLRYD